MILNVLILLVGLGLCVYLFVYGVMGWFKYWKSLKILETSFEQALRDYANNPCIEHEFRLKELREQIYLKKRGRFY